MHTRTHSYIHTCTTSTTNNPAHSPSPELKAEAEHKLKLKKAEVEALHDGFVEKERILTDGATKRVCVHINIYTHISTI